MNAMPTLLQFLRNRWMAAAVHILFWVLLYLAITGFGGKAPAFKETDSFSTPAHSPAPVAKLEHLFDPGVWPKTAAATNLLNPFFTRHFIPPTPPPAPPPPTTRKIELTYHGFYQTADGPQHVLVKLGDAFLDRPVGTNLTANLFAVAANGQTLTLTNTAAQTNILTLNTKKEIEVPIEPPPGAKP